MKKVLSVLLAMGLCVALTIAVTAKITVKSWSADSQILRAYMAGYIEIFEKANPGVKIEPQYIPGDIGQKVMIAIASEMTPDAILDYMGRISSYWMQGVLEPFDGVLSEEDIVDFYPSALAMCRMDGVLVGLPQNLGARTFAANMTLLERAGCANLVPSGDIREWKVEAFEQALAKVSQLEDIYGTMFFANATPGDYHMLGHFQSFGGYLYQNGDYTRVTLNSEGGVQALIWMIDMVDKGFAAPGVAGISPTHHVNAMQGGKIAFGGWVTPTQGKMFYEQGTIDYLPKWRFIEFPYAEGIAPPPMYAGSNLGSVFKDSKVKEYAIEWIKSMMSYEGQTKRITYKPCIPTRRSVVVEDPDMNFLKGVFEKNGIGDLGMMSPYYLQVRDLQFPEFQAAFAKLKTPKEALDDFAEGVRKLSE